MTAQTGKEQHVRGPWGQHTPGPWHVMAHTFPEVVVAYHPLGQQQISQGIAEVVPRTSRTLADASLLAAAPALLEALRALVDSGGDSTDAMMAAGDAIRLAEGR